MFLRFQGVSEGSLLSLLHSITVDTRDTLGQDGTLKIGLMALRFGHHRELRSHPQQSTHTHTQIDGDALKGNNPPRAGVGLDSVIKGKTPA